MPYAEGRIFNDSDSHIMETKDWLLSYADPKIRPRLAPLDLTMAGGKATDDLVSALAAIIARRKNDPAAMARAEANILDRRPLGGPDPESASGSSKICSLTNLRLQWRQRPENGKTVLPP